VPHIRFLTDLPSRSALKDKSELRQVMQSERYHTAAANGPIYRRVTIRFGPSSLMANYSEIKRVVPLLSRLATAVGENWKIGGWEGIEEVRGRTRKLRREVVGRLDDGSVRKNKTAQDRCC